MNHSVSDCVICDQWCVYDGVRTYTFRKDNEGRATQACTTVLGGSSSEWNRTWASGKLMIAGIIQDYTSFEPCPHGWGSCNYYNYVDVAYYHIFLPFCRWAWVWSFYWWLWIIYSIFTCLPSEVPGTLVCWDRHAAPCALCAEAIRLEHSPFRSNGWVEQVSSYVMKSPKNICRIKGSMQPLQPLYPEWGLWIPSLAWMMVK